MPKEIVLPRLDALSRDLSADAWSHEAQLQEAGKEDASLFYDREVDEERSLVEGFESGARRICRAVSRIVARESAVEGGLRPSLAEAWYARHRIGMRSSYHGSRILDALSPETRTALDSPASGIWIEVPDYYLHRATAMGAVDAWLQRFLHAGLRNGRLDLSTAETFLGQLGRPGWAVTAGVSPSGRPFLLAAPEIAAAMDPG